MFDRIVDRIQRGVWLAQAAFKVLRREKKLLVFPILSSLALVLVMCSFAVPLVTSQIFRAFAHQQDAQVVRVGSNVLFYVLVFGFYLCNYFVIIFFNTALVACVLMYFNGEEPTVSDGFQVAFSRLPQIFLWALVSATVGLILKVIAERSGKLGRLITAIIGVTWGIMTYFVVPVLVMDRVGPFSAIKKSMRVMGKTWGEGMTANFGIGLIMFFLYLAALIPVMLGMMIGGWAIAVAYVITLILWLILALVSSVLHAIVMAALYQYATRKHAPRGFKEGMLRNSFASS
jgi:uncharacterized membrane protein